MVNATVISLSVIWLAAFIFATWNFKQQIMKQLLKSILLCLTCFGLIATSCQGQNATKKNTGTKNNNEMKTLIVYFSYTIGNTKGIAEKIQKSLGGDIVRLETVKPYSEDYQTVVRQGQEEVEKGYQPELKPLGVNVKDYDRIIVGTPTWWYRMTPAVLSFLSNNDFSGKVVIPYSTHAGWPGTVIKDMKAVAEKNGASVTDGHEFKFSSNEKHFDKMETSETELNKWIESLKTK